MATTRRTAYTRKELVRVNRTGVFATSEEIERMKLAASPPLIMLQAGLPQSPQQVCHQAALNHGLPEIPGYYGCDLRTGEFVTS